MLLLQGPLEWFVLLYTLSSDTESTLPKDLGMAMCWYVVSQDQEIQDLDPRGIYFCEVRFCMCES